MDSGRRRAALLYFGDRGKAVMIKKIRVAVYRAGREMVVEEIPAGLASYQGMVGGLITEATLANNLALICNDEGINLALPINRTYRFFNGEMGVAFGDFFVCRIADADYVGLRDEDIQKLPSVIDGLTESILNVLRMRLDSEA